MRGSIQGSPSLTVATYLKYPTNEKGATFNIKNKDFFFVVIQK